jgi:UDP-N-acetylmuramate--alanine ligase
VPLPGNHNVQNAWMAVRAALACGAKPGPIAAALATFRGIERRLERVGEAGGVTVVDDYAHNPAKLAAAWNTLAAAFPRVAAVWRPHGYAPLRKMKDALADAFATAMRPGDFLCLLPVYDAGGTADRSINSDTLVEALQARGANAVLAPGAATAEALLLRHASPGVVLATMGARDPDLPRLARRLLDGLGPH